MDIVCTECLTIVGQIETGLLNNSSYRIAVTDEVQATLDQHHDDTRTWEKNYFTGAEILLRGGHGVYEVRNDLGQSVQQITRDFSHIWQMRKNFASL